MKFSVLIATYNQARMLDETLQYLSRLSTNESWEVIIIDNNSSDRTREVVTEAAKTFPVSLKYIFEREQGKAAALNTGMRAAEGEIFAFTDDDARVNSDWLERIAEAFERYGCDYIGGKVLPVWGAERPEWLPDYGGDLWAVVALLDYGPEPMEFGKRVPLGVNMAVRREVFNNQELWWDNRYDRKGSSLRGQGQREWCMRARAAGLRGFYVPDMIVHHHVPRERLNKSYFRRWMYWKGISRALLYQNAKVDMESPERTVLDFSKVPHVAGVPRYMYRKSLQSLKQVLAGYLRKQDIVKQFEHEMWLWFFAGIVRQRWRDRHSSTQ